jgi:hypothetical protein
MNVPHGYMYIDSLVMIIILCKLRQGDFPFKESNKHLETEFLCSNLFKLLAGLLHYAGVSFC